ncbi:hypothetical protein [Clostridium aromativorans]|nr:hypothetical protein [Clostridium aromativorans]
MIEAGDRDFNKLSMFRNIDKVTLKLLREKAFKKKLPKEAFT